MVLQVSDLVDGLAGVRYSVPVRAGGLGLDICFQWLVFSGVSSSGLLRCFDWLLSKRLPD